MSLFYVTWVDSQHKGSESFVLRPSNTRGRFGHTQFKAFLMLRRITFHLMEHICSTTSFGTLSSNILQMIVFCWRPSLWNSNYQQIMDPMKCSLCDKSSPSQYVSIILSHKLAWCVYFRWLKAYFPYPLMEQQACPQEFSGIIHTVCSEGLNSNGEGA